MKTGFLTCITTLAFLLCSNSHLVAQNWAWTPLPTNHNWNSIAMSADGKRVVAVTPALTSPPTDGSIYLSTNSGATWFRPLSSSNVLWQSVACSADGTKMVATARGVFRASGAPIYSSADGGLTWGLTSAPSNSWGSVASSADGLKLAAITSADTGNPKGIFVSTNSGVTWGKTSAPLTNWASIASSADGTKLAAVVQGGSAIDSTGRLISWTGLIYTSTNGGTTWHPTTSPATSWYAIASSTDGSRLAAAVFGGAIYLSTNSGVTWTRSGAPSANWTAIASSADGETLLAGADSDTAPLYTSHDSGKTWVATTVTGGLFWSAVACSADGNLLAAGTFSGGVAMSRSTPRPTLRLR
jgi:hypothetical protein